jgi:O-antigen ligase
VLGFLQVAQGPDSPLRFFEVTNPTDAVGFFANRNHFAAQLYITLAFAAVWISAAARAITRRGAMKTASALSIAGAAALLIVITVGLALTRSRAGLILAMAAVLAVGIMALVTAPRDGAAKRAAWSSARTVLLALGVAVLLAAQFGLARVATRFDGGSVLDDLRVPLNITTFRAAWSALPFGTGLGSFVPVYAAVEKPADAFAGYANRAHNDLAELLLETGIGGLALLLLFLVWYIPRAVAVWRAPADDANPTAVDLERAATLVIALVLAHSLVDYPLRTTAVSALFAFACALLVPPPPDREAPARISGGSRAARRPRPPPLFIEPGSPDPAAKGEVGAWNDKIEWPDAWKSDR